MTTSELLLLVAVVLFGVEGVARVMGQSILRGALVPFGLACIALAFLII